MFSKPSSSTFFLDGTKTLTINHGSDTRFYELHESNADEIFHNRLKRIPTFVLKIDDSFWIAKISKYPDFRCSSDKRINEHLCSSCARCRALISELGGCEKVRNLSVESYIVLGNNWTEAVDMSKRIEKYPFIRYGYESIWTVTESFGVIDCDDYQHLSMVNRY